MQRWLRLASRIERVNERIGQLTWYLTLVMVAAGSYNALTRYVSNLARISLEQATGLDRALRWIGELALQLSSNTFIEFQWYLFSLVFLLGAAYTFKVDAHVRVDVLYCRLGPRGRAWINLCGACVFLIPFCLLMLWTSWPVVADSWAHLEGSPDPGGLPRYPLLTCIPLAFLLLLLQGGAHIIRDIASLRAHRASAHRAR